MAGAAAAASEAGAGQGALPSTAAGRERQRALYALLAPSFAASLVYHVAYRRASAYLLLDAPRARSLALTYVAAAALSFALVRLRRSFAPSLPAAALASLALSHSLSLVAAFFAFGDAATFSLFAPIAALLCGASSGAATAALSRQLPAVAPSGDALLAQLTAPRVAAALSLALAYLLVAERLGPLRAGLVLAICVCITAHMSGSLFAPSLPASRLACRVAAWSAYSLAAALLLVDPLTPFSEAGRVPDPQVWARNGEHGRAVLSSGRGAFQLHVDGLLRLSTIDAHRHREAMAHPAMASASRRERVLLIGGGHGGSLREVLRYPEVREVVLIEPDEPLLTAARSQPVLLREHQGALFDPRVRLVRQDPMRWLLEHDDRFDVALLDLLEPEGPARAKLFTRRFYELVRDHLTQGGLGALSSGSSPLSQRRAFWCTVRTVEAAGLTALPYRASLPVWGPLGFVLFGRGDLPPAPPATTLPSGLTYLDAAQLGAMFTLSPDEAPIEADVNLLHEQVLLRYRSGT